jgi:hypothetical protein
MLQRLPFNLLNGEHDGAVHVIGLPLARQIQQLRFEQHFSGLTFLFHIDDHVETDIFTKNLDEFPESFQNIGADCRRDDNVSASYFHIHCEFPFKVDCSNWFHMQDRFQWGAVVSEAIPDFSLSGPRDLHLFAVLGHGTSGDEDVVAPQQLSDLVVRIWLAPVFVFDQFPDFKLHLNNRKLFAIRVFNSHGEELPQLHNSLRRVYVFVGHYPAYRGAVDPEFARHIFDQHWLEAGRSLLQKLLLPVYDADADLVDGLFPLIHTPQEIHC